MPKMPPTFRPHGRSARVSEQEYDRDRGSAASRLYNGRWVRASKHHLNEHPLCVYCGLVDRVTAASLVDHFWPHRGDVDLFWRREFWISSCGGCHNGMKQSVERQGVQALRILAMQLNLPAL